MGANKKTFGTRAKRATFTASLGSVVRANLNNINPQSVGFVSDTALQLIEAPSIQPEVHPLAKPILKILN